MAIASVTNTKLKTNTIAAMPTATAVDATAGAAVDYSNKSDGRILLILENAHATAAKTATIKSGNGLQGTEDLAVEIAAGAQKVVVIETGKFVNVSGTNKGKVVITGTSADIKVSAIELP